MKPVIRYTNHAVERMVQRRISAHMIETTLSSPDKTERESDGDVEYIKRLNQRTVHAIAKPLDNGEWLIKTVWVRGEPDPSWWMKILGKLAAPLLRRFIIPGA